MTSNKFIYYFKIFVFTPPSLLVIKGTKSEKVFATS